eukprot:2997791-Amphidinium_carterae.1
MQFPQSRVQQGQADAILINAGHTYQGAAAPFAPLLVQQVAGAPPGSNLRWAITGGVPPSGWPANLPDLPHAPIDPEVVLVIADRNSILRVDELSILLAVVGSTRVLSGWPGANGTALTTNLLLREHRPWAWVMITGRGIPAAVPQLGQYPTKHQMASLIDKLSRLLVAGEQWSRGLFRALSDLVMFQLQPPADGAGLGG